MRRWKHIITALFCLGVVWVIGTGAMTSAQDDSVVRVAFIEETATLNMASLTDPGPDGLTRLGEVFRANGAVTGFIPLEQPIPADVDVIVLVRPRRALPPAFLARIYEALNRGVNLLIALDPTRHMGAAPDGALTGLNGLLNGDYGISLIDAFLVEPYYTFDTISRLDTSFSLAIPPLIPHPVTDPLRAFDMRFQLWGARAIDVAALTTESMGVPLMMAEPVYGERDLNYFATPTPSPDPLATPDLTATPTPIPRATPLPLEYQITLDVIGQLNVGAIGVNLSTGSRVVVLADGEMLQNDYGLALSNVDGLPLYIGNQVFAERMTAWLIGSDTYPPLPTGFTYIAVDGVSDDWLEGIGFPTDDALEDTNVLAFDISRLRLFRNTHYLYGFVDTQAPPDPTLELSADLDTNNDGEPDAILFIRPGSVEIEQDGIRTVIPDAAAAYSNGIEFRIPLRVTGVIDALPNFCIESIGELAFPPQPDCADLQVIIQARADIDPTPLRLDADMLAHPQTTDIANIRSGPGVEYERLLAVTRRDLFRVLGRSSDGTWLLVENALVHGWLSADLALTNGDQSLLPVLNADGSPIPEATAESGG